MTKSTKICLVCLLTVLIIAIKVNAKAVDRIEDEQNAGLEEEEDYLDIEDFSFLISPYSAKKCPEGQKWVASVNGCRKTRSHG